VIFRPKLLVVDDELPFLELLGEVLKGRGATPRCVPSSRQAAELADREKFDGVFSDWKMPEMDGLELARHIRWSKSNSRCPIAMLTGAAETEALRQCFRAGVTFFLQKPATVAQIERLFNAARDAMFQEHLRYWRLPLQMRVSAAWAIQDYQQSSKGQSINLSTTGMLAKLETSPTPGTSVDLRFNLPQDPVPLELQSYAVRATPDQMTGLRFVNLDREQWGRLLHFAQHRFESVSG